MTTSTRSPILAVGALLAAFAVAGCCSEPELFCRHDGEAEEPTPQTEPTPERLPHDAALAFAAEPDYYNGFAIFTANDDGSRREAVSAPVDPGQQLSLHDGSWSPNGERIAYVAEDTTLTRHLYVATPDGSERVQVSRHVSSDTRVHSVLWSPDSSRLAYIADAPEGDTFALYLVSADGSDHLMVTDRLRPGEQVEGRPPSTTDIPKEEAVAWSSDGGAIAYLLSSRDNGPNELHIADASGQHQNKANVDPVTGYGVAKFAWNPRGASLLYLLAGCETCVPRVGSPLHRVVLDEDRNLVDNEIGSSFLQFAWSPDGSRIAVLPRGGRFLLTVEPDGGEARYVARSGDPAPYEFTGGEYIADFAWSPDGRHIAYRKFEHCDCPDPYEGQFFELYAATYDGKDKHRVHGPLPPDGGSSPVGASGVLGYEWSPDGTRIAFIARVGEDARFELSIATLDWDAANDLDNGWIGLPDGAPSRLLSTSPYFAAGLFVFQGVRPGARIEGFAWSPDGTRIMSLGDTDVIGELRVVDLKGLEYLVADNAMRPRWSPDGQRIAHVVSERDPNAPLDITSRRYSSYVSTLDGAEPILLTDALATGRDAARVIWRPESRPDVERCDGIDNDGNGLVDDGLSDLITGNDVGQCQTGLVACIDGRMATVERYAGPAYETCDGIDNDCDGEVDEDVGQRVDTPHPNYGVCQPEISECVNGRFVVLQEGIGPIDELCDGLDNDCDGEVDEGYCQLPPLRVLPSAPTAPFSSTALRGFGITSISAYAAVRCDAGSLARDTELDLWHGASGSVAASVVRNVDQQCEVPVDCGTHSRTGEEVCFHNDVARVASATVDAELQQSNDGSLTWTIESTWRSEQALVARASYSIVLEIQRGHEYKTELTCPSSCRSFGLFDVSEQATEEELINCRPEGFSGSPDPLPTEVVLGAGIYFVRGECEVGYSPPQFPRKGGSQVGITLTPFDGQNSVRNRPFNPLDPIEQNDPSGRLGR